VIDAVMQYVANARMYSVNPQARAAWADLFAFVSRESGVDLQVIDHAFPAPLAQLWSRSDLACAFMCGLPYVRSGNPPKPIVAAVPRGAPIAGQPVYATRLVVNASSPFQRIEDTFGGRVGFTVEDSHSGYNALRHHLLPYRLARGTHLYRESVGPLYTPRRVIEALLSDTIDVGPLDSYGLDLMLHHEPDLRARIRVVATTEAAPIPFLVASAGCPDEVVTRLQSVFLAFAETPLSAELRERLCLEGFAPVTLADYDVIARWDDEAKAADYGHPG
jgi:ABC-type phosphate/phosphonate transport system substrate-binding protein